jgi:hypothetical protein
MAHGWLDLKTVENSPSIAQMSKENEKLAVVPPI